MDQILKALWKLENEIREESKNTVNEHTGYPKTDTTIHYQQGYADGIRYALRLIEEE